MSQPVEVPMRANLSSSVISKKTKAIGTTRSMASYGDIRLDLRRVRFRSLPKSGMLLRTGGIGDGAGYEAIRSYPGLSGFQLST